MNNPIHKKLAKLLALARDGRGNTTEAETALRQAEALMRKHGIEEASVILHAIETNTLDLSSENVDTLSGRRLPDWINFLGTGIARFTDTIGSVSRTPDGRACMRFSGMVADVQVATFLLPYLMEAIDRERKADGVGREVAVYRKTASLVLQKRMYILRKEREYFYEGSGTSLMVVQSKMETITQKFGRPKIESIGSLAVNNIHVATLGAAAGARINISQQLENNHADEQKVS